MIQQVDFSPNEIFGLQRTNGRPQLDRVRFTPNDKTAQFLQDCKERGYDVSTIINLAIDCFIPKTKNNGYTWDGIDNVI